MSIHRIQNTILATMIHGQGNAIAVCGWLAFVLRAVALETCGLLPRGGDGNALLLKRKPAALALAPATCRATCSARRLQRDRRWTSGVVVGPGTVGVV